LGNWPGGVGAARALRQETRVSAGSAKVCDGRSLSDEAQAGDADVLGLQDELEANEQQIAALEAQVGALRAELAARIDKDRLERREEGLVSYKQAKWDSDLEIIELRTLLRDTEHQVDQIRQSVEFRLGRVIVEASQSRRAFFMVGFRLLKVYLEVRAQERKTSSGRLPDLAPDAGSAKHAHAIRLVREMVLNSGPASAASWVRRRMFKPSLAARLLVEIAKACRETDMPMAVGLASEALALDQTEHRVRWVALLLAQSGAVTESAQLMRRAIRAGSPLSGAERRFADEIFALERLLKNPPDPPRASRRPTGTPRRILLIARQSVPYHWSMATLRLHAMALAIRASGREVVVATLPGYPLSDGARSDRSAVAMIDGVPYHTLPPVGAAIDVIDAFIPASIPPLVAFARKHGVQAVHTDSGIVTAYVGLAVARALDVPAVLDVAGDEAFAAPTGMRCDDTERFKLSRAVQARLVAAADALVVHAPMTADLAPAGAAPPSVTIFDPGPVLDESHPARRLPNPVREHAALRGRMVLGFLGEPVPGYDFYLLPDVLLRILSDPAAGIDPALLVAGVGRRIENIRERAVARGHGDRVVVMRRPAMTELAGIYSAMDVFVAPLAEREGLPARAPMEILMALSHGLAVVAPDLKLTRNWAAAGLPIVLAQGGSVDSLADAVANILRDPVGRAAIANRAHVWSVKNTARRIASAALDRIYQFDEDVRPSALVG
jgi:glycosyltransferase involved in cell wall biosynthesis